MSTTVIAYVVCWCEFSINIFLITEVTAFVPPCEIPSKDIWTNRWFCSLGSTSNIDSDQGPHKGDGEPTSSSGLSTTTTVTSQPGTAHVPGRFPKLCILII